MRLTVRISGCGLVAVAGLSWLLTHIVDGNATTGFSYNNVGDVTRMTPPDGAFIDDHYDAARRLTGITDRLGNSIDYTLDAADNRSAEEMRGATGGLTYRLGRLYDSLGRVRQQLNAQNAASEFSHDANGNQDRSADALSRVTTGTFDALDRLVQTTDALLGSTQYRYDAKDNTLSQAAQILSAPTFQYDKRNRFTALSAQNVNATYQHNARGERVFTRVMEDAAPVWRYALRAVQQRLQQCPVL